MQLYDKSPRIPWSPAAFPVGTHQWDDEVSSGDRARPRRACHSPCVHGGLRAAVLSRAGTGCRAQSGVRAGFPARNVPTPAPGADRGTSRGPDCRGCASRPQCGPPVPEPSTRAGRSVDPGHPAANDGSGSRLRPRQRLIGWARTVTVPLDERGRSRGGCVVNHRQSSGAAHGSCAR